MALFCTVEFALPLARPNHPHLLLVDQFPHLHQIPCAANGVSINGYRITTSTLRRANRHPLLFAEILLKNRSVIINQRLEK